MADRREVRAPPAGLANGAAAPAPAAEGAEARVLLLECRLEQLRGALAAAREEADRARTRLAEVSAREASHARRQSLLHEELADARAEIASLHRQLERSEALRAEMEGHLLEAGPRADAAELLRLRQEVAGERERAQRNGQAAERLRARVDALLASRETLLTRFAEWQQLVHQHGPEAADLAEFMAELRGEILGLERGRSEAEAREAALRERLLDAGLDPGPAPEPEHGRGAPAAEPPLAAAEGSAPPAQEEEPAARPTLAGGRISGAQVDPPADVDDLMEALAEARAAHRQAELLLRLARTGSPAAVHAVRPWTAAGDASVRAAAYEALGRLLEHAPETLEPHLRSGLGDSDARVRRRVALSAATARGIDLRRLLAAVADDPDPHVRRLVRQVLRHAPSAEDGAAALDPRGQGRAGRGPAGERSAAPAEEEADRYRPLAASAGGS